MTDRFDALDQRHPMRRLTLAERLYPPAVIVLPVAGVVLAALFAVRTASPVISVAAFGVMYTMVGLGLALGYHRLLSHASFETSRPVRYALAVLGTMSGQGLFFNWIADHRLHHAHTDAPGDPHSPHWCDRQELSGLAGLMHAHVGWMFRPRRGGLELLIPDLTADAGMRMIDRLSPLIVLGGLALPPFVVLLGGATATDAAAAFLWGGPVRMFVLNHTTWCVNSIGHAHGPQHFESRDQSRDHPVLAWLAFGDGWHNGHHAFPRSARHGLVRGQFDPCYEVIKLMARLGLAWNVYLPSADRVKRKLLAPTRISVALDLVDR